MIPTNKKLFAEDLFSFLKVAYNIIPPNKANKIGSRFQVAYELWFP